jgi:beta-phosphoglucomutase-like phosphatase (HAD superfamily)
MRTPVASCMVVEDTAIGVRAALAAEMSAIGLASGTEAQLIGQLGARTIESLADLLPLLEGLG